MRSPSMKWKTMALGNLIAGSPTPTVTPVSPAMESPGISEIAYIQMGRRLYVQTGMPTADEIWLKYTLGSSGKLCTQKTHTFKSPGGTECTMLFLISKVCLVRQKFLTVHHWPEATYTAMHTLWTSTCVSSRVCCNTHAVLKSWLCWLLMVGAKFVLNFSKS